MADWHLFTLCAPDQRSDAPRSIDTPEGVGDRLRAAAFAEVQARDAFNWAAEFFTDAPADLRGAWRSLAIAEEKHLQWLLARMRELGVSPSERKVSDGLWRTLRSCKSAREFALFMASAEDRGRKAGERFQKAMAEKDLVSAEIFGKIAEEERSHIDLARRFFPESSRVETVTAPAGAAP